MSTTTEELMPHTKLAKLVAAFHKYLNEECIEAILQSPGDINYSIPRSEQLYFLNSSLRPGTVLHQLLRIPDRSEAAKIYELLIRHGADITKKNSDGQTALHAKIVHCSKVSDDYDYRIIKTILSAHVDYSIPDNPRDDSNGITHFHAACMRNHATAIDFFLENGVDVDQAVNQDSEIFPGCTALHLAAYHSSPEAAKKLIQHGADVHLKDAEGLTALQVLVRKSLEIAREKLCGELGQDYRVNEEVVGLLLTSENFIRDNATPIVANEYGFTNFHAACTLNDVSLAKSLLAHVGDVGQAISVNSPFCPGYTALHFAAHFSVDLVKFLLEKRANLLSRDASGVTPLDVCAQTQSIEDVHYVISRHPSLRDITFSDNKTKLLDLLRAMQSVTSYEEFLDELEDLNCRLDEASPAWPGYTPLHFNVLFFEQVKAQCGRSMIGEFLDRGADCGTRDARGSSPLHLAFHLQKKAAISEIFASARELADSTDENNVSHLIVACTVDGDDVDAHPVRRLVRAGADVNLVTRSSVEFAGKKFLPKTSPLHVLVVEHKHETARFLIEHGADLNATDDAGWSPVHRLMPLRSSSIDENMAHTVFSFAAKLEERVVEDIGLSHLHVACRFGSLSGVAQLLDLGSNANAALKCHEYYPGQKFNYKGCTPLHFALQKSSLDIANALLAADADILATNAAGVSPLYQVFSLRYGYGLAKAFVAQLRNREDLLTRLRNITGMTMLHLLAFDMDAEGVEELIAAGADVNAKLPADSPIWPGCTPLHAWDYGRSLGYPDEVAIDRSLNALLSAGADVTISNARNVTPLLSRNPRFVACTAEFGFGEMPRYQKDFRVNPVNCMGFSHFHISVVLDDLATAEEFLKNGVDVNQRVDALSEAFAGFSPLHLLACSNHCSNESLSARTKMLELLLSCGADVHARDVLGNTPLHYALTNGNRSRGIEYFEILTRAGAEVHATNLAGETPFDAAIGVLSVEEMEFYLRQGYRLNVYNAVDGTGFLARALVKDCYNRKNPREQLQLFLDNPDIKSIDNNGRTAIHNVVSTRHASFRCIYTYILYIDELVNLGCDIDAQDCTGKTALHTAALFKNDTAVKALLSSGADINVVDAEGKLALEYDWDVSRFEGRNVIFLIVVHIKTMLLIGIHVSQRNCELAQEALETVLLECKLQTQTAFREQLEEIRHTDIAGADSLRLENLLSETGYVTAYPTMPLTKRLVFDRIFSGKNEVMKRVSSVSGLLRLQYNKMKKRAGLIESAHVSLHILSSIPLPRLICEEISRYLSFYDLKNLIASTNDEYSLHRKSSNNFCDERHST